jgi:hypothetical protein
MSVCEFWGIMANESADAGFKTAEGRSEWSGRHEEREGKRRTNNDNSISQGGRGGVSGGIF